MPDRQKNDVTRLRELIAQAGLSQRAAAEQLGISDRIMRYYAAGTQPIPRTVLMSLELIVERKKK